MAGEPVRPECDHDIRIELVEQLRCEPDQVLVDVRESAIRIVEAPSLGEPEFLAGRLEFALSNDAQCGSGRHARVPDLAGTALGERDHPDFGAGTRVLGQRATGAEGLVIGMGEHSQQTQGPATGTAH